LQLQPQRLFVSWRIRSPQPRHLWELSVPQQLLFLSRPRVPGAWSSPKKPTRCHKNRPRLPYQQAQESPDCPTPRPLRTYLAQALSPDYSPHVNTENKDLFPSLKLDFQQVSLLFPKAVS